MPRQGGEQHDVQGPVVYEKGMNAVPVHELPPAEPENVWNLDYDHAGRPIPRAGSVFQSRIGEGPVIGLHEHTFESGRKRPRPAAIVRDAYRRVYALVNPDPHTVNEIPYDGEPEPELDFGFCPDWTEHGRVILRLPARIGDRFQMVSFLNQLYVAGSTSDFRIRRYDYDVQMFDALEGVRGRAIAAVGNRLFVAGDPNHPNVVYPSDPDDPDTFQPQLGMQVGTRNDEILALVEHGGLLVVLSTHSAHWLLPGAVELGDIETETISKVHGVTGPLAVTEAADGWVYWLSPSEGPMRWARGQGAPDTSFAARMAPIWRVIMKGRMRTAVVFDDVAAGAVRFLVASGDCPEPNYILSYFYRMGGSWTHGASTTRVEGARKIRDFADPAHAKIGTEWYTAARSMADRLLGGYRVFAGDDQGTLWAWSRGVYDRVRGYTHPESPFRCFMRPGPLAIGPMGHRGTIRRAALNLMAGYNWSFRIDSELDFDDQWRNVQHSSHTTPGGIADSLILDDEEVGRPLNRHHHPTFHFIPFWHDGLARVVRYEISFDPLFPVSPISLEFERHLAAEGFKRHFSPPIPFGRTADWCEEPAEPCPPIDVSEIEFPEV